VKTPLLRQLLLIHEQELLFLHRVGLRTGSSGHVPFRDKQRASDRRCLVQTVGSPRPHAPAPPGLHSPAGPASSPPPGVASQRRGAPGGHGKRSEREDRLGPRRDAKRQGPPPPAVPTRRRTYRAVGRAVAVLWRSHSRPAREGGQLPVPLWPVMEAFAAIGSRFYG
jgi:hypothetical protein